MTFVTLIILSALAGWWLWRQHVDTMVDCGLLRKVIIIGWTGLSIVLSVVLLTYSAIGSSSDAAFRTFSRLFLCEYAITGSLLLLTLCDMIGRVPSLVANRYSQRGPRKSMRVWIDVWSGLGCVLAVAVWVATWWGSAVNRYAIDVRYVTVEIPDLPEAFDGYRLVQISDLHVGTWGNDTTMLSRVVDAIEAEGADMVVFTGDIVNRHADEMRPMLPVLRRLHAPDGVYAILGNHDYGEYYHKHDAAKAQAECDSIVAMYGTTDIDLLVDTHRYIYRDGDSIAVIGVGNVGHDPYPNRGSLQIAYPAMGDSVTKILLSHDPTHWADSIASRPEMNVALTLSGHTHAAQMMVGRLSPAALLYRHWAGLYADKEHHHQLYVNIGIGTVGLPMRIGATPEITVITLRR